jgi:hypothetical protein
VLDYLSRYTHRIAISNHRLRGLDDGHVTFDYRDRRDGNRVKQLTIAARKFIRRFLMHAVRPGFAGFGIRPSWPAGLRRSACSVVARSWVKRQRQVPKFRKIRWRCCCI